MALPTMESRQRNGERENRTLMYVRTIKIDSRKTRLAENDKRRVTREKRREETRVIIDLEYRNGIFVIFSRKSLTNTQKVPYMLNIFRANNKVIDEK